MNNEFHYITTWCSSLIILIMGGLFVIVGIPKTSHWKQLRYGCFCLAASYIILGLAGLIEAVLELSGRLLAFKSELVLAVSFFQAMLFTGTSIAFLRLRRLKKKLILKQLVAIMVLLASFFCAYFYFTSLYPYFFGITVAAYIGQLIYYTSLFNKEYNWILIHSKPTNPLLFANRMHRVSRLFYVSLGVGIMALVYVLLPEKNFFTEAFTISYTFYYVFLVFSIISFLPYFDIDELTESASQNEEETTGEIKVNTSENLKDPIMAAALTGDTSENIEVPTLPPTNKLFTSEVSNSSLSATDTKNETRAERRLTEALDRWVEEEKYLCPDVPIEEIATELGTDVYSLHDYFLSHKGILFRTWRVMLRIEKAKQLLETNPNIKISELQLKVGFSDKSYFFRRFKQVTGKTPNEYRHDLQL